jgi:hypothetical protein
MYSPLFSVKLLLDAVKEGLLHISEASAFTVTTSDFIFNGCFCKTASTSTSEKHYMETKYDVLQNDK